MAFSFQLITWNFVPSTTSYRFQPSYSQHCKVHWPGYPTWNSSGCRLLRLHDSKIPTPSTFWENICTPRKTNMEPPQQKLECFGSFFFFFPKKMVDFSGLLAISFAGRIYIYIYTHASLGLMTIPWIYPFEGVAGVRDTLFRGEWWSLGYKTCWLHSPHHGRNEPRNPNWFGETCFHGKNAGWICEARFIVWSFIVWCRSLYINQ